MARQKAQLTLLERMGFADSDLATARHDEIMLWLDERLRAGALTMQILEAINAPKNYRPPDKAEWDALVSAHFEPWSKEAARITASLNEDIANLEQRALAAAASLDDAELREKAGKAYQAYDAALEASRKGAAAAYQQCAEKGRAAAAVALAVQSGRVKSDVAEAAWSCLRDEIERREKLAGCKGRRERMIEASRRVRALPVYSPEAACKIVLTWERPITSGGKFIVGYCDLFATLTAKQPCLWGECEPARWGFEPESATTTSIGFEVKTEIRSLGEVVRQIRTYQEHCRDWHWFIVYPDDRFAEPLRSQGIHFLNYEPTVEGQAMQ